MTSTILAGADLWTADWTSPRPAELRVVDGRIAEIGTPGSLSSGRRVDLDGRLLIPAFQDAHAHPLTGGLGLLTCELNELGTLDDILRRVGDHARDLPSDAWVTGQGWSKQVVLRPDRFALDVVSGGRPAVLRSLDCHSIWANSAALSAAGIDASTPDPVGGHIARDDAGEPTGLLDETAMALVERVQPAPSAARIEEGLLRGESRLLDLGVASWQDALVGTGLGLVDTLDAYASLVSSARLTGRVTAALWWDPLRPLDQLAEVRQRRAVLEEAGDRDAIVADTVKVMIDGAGVTFIEDAPLREIVVAVDAAGLSVHFHACSDRAVHAALDAVEHARAVNGWSGARHHIAHILVIAQADLPRFRELGVTANMQAVWAVEAPPLALFHLPFIDAHPEHHGYPFGQLARHGAALCAGSDWPVSSPDPLAAASVAVRRRTADAAGAPVADPLEDLDLAAFLAAATAGSAHVNGRGDRTGRLAEGYLADLALLDRNVFEGNDPSQAHVTGLWVGGRRVRG